MTTWVKEFVNSGVACARCGRSVAVDVDPNVQKKFSRIFQKILAGHPGCSQPTKTACQSREPIENGLGKSTAHVGWFWSQTPNFEPVELLVPPLPPPDTAVAACFLLKKRTCKVWAGGKGGPVSGRSPRHGRPEYTGLAERAKLARGLTQAGMLQLQYHGREGLSCHTRRKTSGVVWTTATSGKGEQRVKGQVAAVCTGWGAESR